MLRDSKPKTEGGPSKSRKEEQAKQLAEKMVSFDIDDNIFHSYYSY